MADESARPQHGGIEEQQSGAMRETGRAARGSTRATREGTQAVARSIRQGAEETARAARAGMEELGEHTEHITQEMAEDAERISAEIASETSDMVHEIARLAVLPQVASRSFQTAQEVANSAMRCAMETNLRIIAEMSRTANPALLFQAQQRVLRQVVHGMVEHGTEIVRASHRLVQQTLQPMEGDYAGQHPRRPQAWVGELMSREVRIANPDQTVEEAARLMSESNTGALPVGENDRLVGMITDRDIALRVVAQGKNPRDTRVRETMTEKIKYCFDDESIDSVARKMGDQQIRRLPVLNRDKRLVGIISLGDISTRHSPERAGEALRGVSQAA